MVAMLPNRIIYEMNLNTVQQCNHFVYYKPMLLLVALKRRELRLQKLLMTFEDFLQIWTSDMLNLRYINIIHGS